jgi:predicted dienelactone hydrolase
VLLAWLGAYGSVMTRGDIETSELEHSDVPFAAPGAHAVGTAAATVPGNRQIEATVWYPASAAGLSNARAVTYPYEVTMFGGLGTVALATHRGRAHQDVTPDLSGAPYPLVVLSPGFALGGSSYGWLAEHLASHGLVVIAPEHDEVLDPSSLWRSTVQRPRDISAVLSYADRPGGEMDGLVDAESVAVIGHSYGGYAAQAAGGALLDTRGFTASCADARRTGDPVVFLCDALEPRLADMAELAGLDATPRELWPDWSDARVDAVVSLAGDALALGEAGLSRLRVPVLAIGGTRDRDTPYASGPRLTYRNASSPRKVEVGLVGAEHFVFAGQCQSVRRVLKLVPNNFCSDPGWNRETAHDLVRHYVTAFLAAALHGDATAAAALAPGRGHVADVDFRSQGYPG